MLQDCYKIFLLGLQISTNPSSFLFLSFFSSVSRELRKREKGASEDESIWLGGFVSISSPRHLPYKTDDSVRRLRGTNR